MEGLYLPLSLRAFLCTYDWEQVPVTEPFPSARMNAKSIEQPALTGTRTSLKVIVTQLTEAWFRETLEVSFVILALSEVHADLM